jgi:hypothetical protein
VDGSLFRKKSKSVGKKLDEDVPGLGAIKTELELMKQDIYFLKTTLMPDGSSNKIDRISNQIQIISQDLAFLKSNLAELIEKLSNK